VRENEIVAAIAHEPNRTTSYEVVANEELESSADYRDAYFRILFLKRSITLPGINVNNAAYSETKVRTISSVAICVLSW
jgi:hypothetical protein